MSKTGFAGRICRGLALLALLSPLATAQSTITGVVRDTSGAFMAGVRVEAASEALIERSRTATTALDGRYTIVDVRPGQYTITFTVEGFATVRQQIEIPANVTVPVDAEMKVGSVGESVTVESRVATVDVDNVAHPAVLSRSDMDAIPSARNMQSLVPTCPAFT